MNNTNVVVLQTKNPRQKIPQSLDEVIAHVQSNRKEHANYVIEDITNEIFAMAALEGFDLTKQECFRETALAVEAFKAALYKSVNVEHPLQKLAETVVNVQMAPGTDEESYSESD